MKYIRDKAKIIKDIGKNCPMCCKSLILTIENSSKDFSDASDITEVKNLVVSEN